MQKSCAKTPFIYFSFTLTKKKKKNHISSLYSFLYANLVFKTKLKDPILLLLREPYDIFINLKK